MLIKASGALHPGLYLLTLGHSCHYLIGSPADAGTQGFVLFDPGASAHLPYLEKRLAALGFSLDQATHIFLTHLHADRAGSIPSLKKRYPRIRVCASSRMAEQLEDEKFIAAAYQTDQQLREVLGLSLQPAQMSLDEYHSSLSVDTILGDSDLLELPGDISMRAISTPGHSEESMSYLLLPYNYLIVDEGFGYYRGREFAAPGGDWDLEQSVQSIHKLLKLDLSGLCFPNTGFLSGQLVRKHLQSVLQNVDDLRRECEKASQHGFSLEHIRESVMNAFYQLHSTQDPNLGFVVVDGFQFGEAYTVKPPHGDKDIDLREDDEYAILVLVTVRPDPRSTTANLKAPVFVNIRTRKGVQIIFDDPRYSTRFPLWSEDKEAPQGEEPKK